MNTTTVSTKLATKVALVTGASKGIGAAIATQLAAAGASVIVNYASSKTGADKVVAAITAAGGKAVALQADVSKKADIDRLFAEASAKFGRIDVVVNNAGVYEFAPIEGINEEHFHRQFNLNVLGLLLVSQKAVAQFDAKAGGTIINVGSLASTAGLPGAATYSATKAAVDAVTRSLATELGPRNIRVNSLNPGVVETEGFAAAGFSGTDFHKEAIAKNPLGRVAQPDDIADVAVFLASNDARWITGQEIFATGGSR